MAEKVMRDFDAEFPFKKSKGPSFKLGGKVFHTRGNPGILTFSSQNRGIRAAIDIISGHLEKEEREVFIEMMNDPDCLVTDEAVDEIAVWLFKEAVSNRPTASPAESGDTAGTNSNGSKVSAISEVATGQG